MSNIRTRALRTLIASALTGLVGCASVQAPHGYLPDASSEQIDVYGGWITLEYSAGNSVETADGEFIAFQDSSVYVLTEFRLIRIPSKDVRRASVDIYSKNTLTFALWTVAGTASATTHGWYVIISAPLWLLTGIPSTISESMDGRLERGNPSTSWWLSASKFSRFPQGIPKGIDPDNLALKKYRYE